MQTDRRIDGLCDKRADRQSGSQTVYFTSIRADRRIGRYAGRQTDGAKPDRQTDTCKREYKNIPTDQQNTETYKQTSRQPCIQADRQPVKQTDRQTSRQTDNQADEQAGKQTNKQIGKQTDIEVDKQTSIQTAILADNEADILTSIQADRQYTRQAVHAAGRQTVVGASRLCKRQPVVIGQTSMDPYR